MVNELNYVINTFYIQWCACLIVSCLTSSGKKYYLSKLCDNYFNHATMLSLFDTLCIKYHGCKISSHHLICRLIDLWLSNVQYHIDRECLGRE